MYNQNTVIILGPTNVPEALRCAVDMPTMDHRSAAFKGILHPALNGVKQVLKSNTAEVVLFPSTGLKLRWFRCRGGRVFRHTGLRTF